MVDAVPNLMDQLVESEFAEENYRPAIVEGRGSPIYGYDMGNKAAHLHGDAAEGINHEVLTAEF